MELIPAVDLLGGRVVRLARGDYARVTTFGADPIETARRWEQEGAVRLHLVDLDGARAGEPLQLDLVAHIIDAVAVPCQVAGGLRTVEAVTGVLQRGADRVVLGSALVRRPALASELLDRHGPQRIVAAIDVRDGAATTDGWVPGGATAPADEHVRSLSALGVRLFVVTAIDRDGVGGGPDLEVLQWAADAAGGPGRVIASAGISSVEDIAALAAGGYAGAILGRALYDGTLTLEAALAAGESGPR